MLLDQRERTIFASHFQFYIEDPDFPTDPSSSSFWTEKAINNHLAVGPGVLGIGTGSYGVVRLISESHDLSPEMDLDQWDHVTEASLDISQGRLQIMGCLDDGNEEIFQVASSNYRVRCCQANLEESVDGGEGGDCYLVQFWPAEPMEPEVLKRWTGI